MSALTVDIVDALVHIVCTAYLSWYWLRTLKVGP
jgi:hypothetical protein